MPQTKLEIKELVPLALLYSSRNHQIEGRTRMQKLVFLAQDELEDQGIDTLDFVPYKYGPFSKPLIETIENFEKMGLLEREKERAFDGTEKYIYSLTPKGKQSFRYNLEDGGEQDVFRTVLDVSSKVLREHNKKSISKLIDHVYEKHPDYAKNSVY